MGQTLELFLHHGEKDVVDAGAVQVAGNEALAAESLDHGLVALLADLAVKLEMLHCFLF